MQCEVTDPLQVLLGMRGKGFLDEQTVDQIEDVIKERGMHDDDLGTSPPAEDEGLADKSQREPNTKSSKRQTPGRLDKRQVEQRIEEDRERHKRERESIWAIPRGDNAELNKLWDETSDYGEDDERLVTEESQDFATEMDIGSCDHLRHANGNGA